MHPRKSSFSIKIDFSEQIDFGLQLCVSLQKEVKDLSVKLNQVLGAVAKLTKQTSAPGLLQEAAGAQSAPGSVSDDSNSSESAVPVYSGDRLALCVGEADINLEHDPQIRHLSHQWRLIPRSW